MSIISIQVFDRSGGHFVAFDSPSVTVAVVIAITILAWSLAIRIKCITFGSA